jgi:putative acetyltransferase
MGRSLMARANPTKSLRPFLPTDTAMLAEIFRASIEGLTADDYDEAQQAAWIATADDEDAFGKRLAERLTLVGTLEGSPVGFVSLEGADRIDMLYVHPAVARQGVATMLVDALEKLAASRGTARLTVDASDTAAPFFEARGYTAQRRNTVIRGEEWLANTTMDKQLAAKGRLP